MIRYFHSCMQRSSRNSFSFYTFNVTEVFRNPPPPIRSATGRALSGERCARRAKARTAACYRACLPT